MPVRWPLAFYKAANPVGPLPAAVGLGGAARRMLNSLTHTRTLRSEREAGDIERESRNKKSELRE
jgi:hypothetical protein